MKLEPAPAAVVRAAAWPLDSLDVFGAPALLESSPNSATFAAAYAAVLENERRALLERTAGDPRFMKALAFSSPSLFERAGRLASRLQRNKRARHTETSLYRYLARAATRTTPNGLWAGVTLAAFSASESVRTTATDAAIAPDLTPFAAALAVLGQRPLYRDAARFGINPSLCRVAGGALSFVAPARCGRSETRLIEAPPAIVAEVEALAERGAGSLKELAAASRLRPELLLKLWQAGALIGGLTFPTRFTSPWDALRAAGEQLLGAERGAWSAAVEELLVLAGELGAALETSSPEHVLGQLGRARESVVTLMSRLAAEVEVPGVVLRCDLRLPFAVTLGASRRAALLQALDAYQKGWIDGSSPLSAARRERRRATVAALERAPLTIGEPAPQPPAAACETAWQALWDAARANGDPALTLPETGAAGEAALQSPWGCLFARLNATAVSTVFGFDDNPVRSFSRFSTLLGHDNDLERWVRGELARFSADHGLIAADVVIPFDPNPNALACPEVGAVRLEPWAVGGTALRGARLVAQAGTLVLEVPELGRMTVLSLSSGAVLEHDRLGAWLAQAGFDEPVDPDFRAVALAGSAEAGSLGYTPRVAVRGDLTIRPRGTAISGAPLSELSRLERAARFVWWRDLGRRLGWARRMTLRVDDGPPLLVDGASPLAVEAALEGVGNARKLLVEEADTAAWLGGRHVADVALPFAREPHAFSALRRG